MSYVPQPIASDAFNLSPQLHQLTELLAKNAHEVWAKTRQDEGWTYGPVRNDAKKQHPCLVPYEKLPESEKEVDRRMAIETLKVIQALGYRIEKS